MLIASDRDPPVPHVDRGIAVVRGFRIVRDHQDGLPQPPVQVAQNLQHGLRILRVEIPGGLVGQQNRRVIHNRPRNRHALLLAAGERIRFVIQPLPDPQQAQHFLEFGFRLRGRAPDVARHRDVVARRQVGQQVEFLEHESHRAFAHARALRVGHRRQVLVAHHDFPRGGRRQPADNVKQRRLPRARRADDRKEVALLHVEIHAAQGRHVHLAHAIGLAQIADLDDVAVTHTTAPR